MSRLVVVAAVLAGLLACGGGAEPTVDAAEVGAIAARIKADPAAAAQILDGAGYTRERFEQALYTIAEDPALTETYLRALE